MPSATSLTPIHIAIIGGGIGGVTLGVALSAFSNLTFTIYESRSAFGEIGAGIGFGANSHLAMNLISPALWECYKESASFNGWEEKQNVWFDFTVGEKGENEGKRIVEVRMPGAMTQSTTHRAHFLDLLVKQLPEGCAEFNKRLVGVDQTGEKVVCKFADGTEVQADAVVGCDGIKSGCRKFVYDDEKLVEPVFTKTVAYRGLVPMDVAEAALGKEKANCRQMYLGHGGHMLTFPVAKGAMMNAVAFHSTEKDTWEGEWVQPLQKYKLQRDFTGWGTHVTKIMEVRTRFRLSTDKLTSLQLMQSPDVWAIFDHPQVPTFHKDRLCLLGDAAHAMSPHYGQGAGMAIEDAYVLSNLLGECTSTADIDAAFEAYDLVRVPRALKVVSESREQGKALDLKLEGIGDDLEKLAIRLNKTVIWVWDGDLNAHLALAMKKFEEARKK